MSKPVFIKDLEEHKTKSLKSLSQKIENAIRTRNSVERKSSVKNKKKISYKLIAFKLGIAEKKLERWRKGQATPSFTELVCFSDLLQINFKYFSPTVDCDDIDNYLLPRVLTYESVAKMEIISKPVLKNPVKEISPTIFVEEILFGKINQISNIADEIKNQLTEF